MSLCICRVLIKYGPGKPLIGGLGPQDGGTCPGTKDSQVPATDVLIPRGLNIDIPGNKQA